MKLDEIKICHGSAKSLNHLRVKMRQLLLFYWEERGGSSMHRVKAITQGEHLGLILCELSDQNKSATMQNMNHQR